MKLELKTENVNYSKSFSNVLRIFLKLALIFIFCDIAIKLGFVSKHYQIEYNCKLLYVEKSKLNFEKLSKLSNLKGKQRIWDFCREVVK